MPLTDVPPTCTGLLAKPRSWVSRTFVVSDPSGTTHGELKLHWGFERARYKDAAGEARLLRDGFTGPFLMRRRGRPVARAVKPSFWRRTFEVHHDGLHYELRPRGLGRTFEIWRRGHRSARIRPVSWLSRAARLEASEELPVELGVFLVWLVLILWRRSESAAHGSGG